MSGNGMLSASLLSDIWGAVVRNTHNLLKGVFVNLSIYIGHVSAKAIKQ